MNIKPGTAKEVLFIIYPPETLLHRAHNYLILTHGNPYIMLTLRIITQRSQTRTTNLTISILSVSALLTTASGTGVKPGIIHRYILSTEYIAKKLFGKIALTSRAGLHDLCSSLIGHCFQMQLCDWTMPSGRTTPEYQLICHIVIK